MDATFLAHINEYITQRESERVLNLIHVFDYEREDFVSLRNESRSTLMDPREIENVTIRAVVPNVSDYIFQALSFSLILNYLKFITVLYYFIIQFNLMLSNITL